MIIAVPTNCKTDGCYASKDNLYYATKEGVENIVFNKLVAVLIKTAVSSLNMDEIKKC